MTNKPEAFRPIHPDLVYALLGDRAAWSPERAVVVIGLHNRHQVSTPLTVYRVILLVDERAVLSPRLSADFERREGELEVAELVYPLNRIVGTLMRLDPV